MRLENGEAYNLGYKAGEENRSASHNPFKEHTPQSEEWFCGWEDGTHDNDTLLG